MASYVQAQSTVTSSAILFLGRALSGSSSMVISVTNAQLDMIIDMITSGLIQIVSTNASLAASVGMTADATAVISVLSAQLGGIFSVYTNGTISITPTAVLSALAFMEAEAGGPTPLSPEGLAAALWNSSSTTYNDPGTMGALVNAAGGSASPAIIAAAIWDELVVSHTVSGTYGEKVQKLLTLSQFLGLK